MRSDVSRPFRFTRSVPSPMQRTTRERVRVVVADPMAKGGLRELERHFQVSYLPEIAESEWWSHLGDASAVVVRKFSVDADTLDRLPHVEAVVKHGAGVDNIDVDAATRRGVAVLSTPGVGAAAVAEHAVMLALMVCRRARDLHDAVVDGRFEAREDWRLTEIEGKTVGIVGFGSIGRHVARIFRDGFGAAILAYDPAVDAKSPDLRLAEMATLDDLLASADVVTVHAPLTAETRHMIGARELALMKPRAALVNTARGGLIDERALVTALRDGKLAGAGLDVFEQEPPDAHNELLALPNVICSPHIAGLTAEAADRLSQAAAAAVVAILARSDRLDGLLNPEYARHRSDSRTVRNPRR